MTQSIPAFAWTVPMVVLAGAAMGGCFDCRNDLGEVSWEQAGLFDQLPSTGERGGFIIDYSTQNGTVQVKTAWRSTDEELLHLHVYENGTVKFSTIQWSKISDEKANEKILWTFQRLELGTPARNDFHLKWSNEGC